MRRRLVLLVAMALGLSACADASSSDNGSLTVVATTTILGDIASSLADGVADVEVILPPLADPHDYQLSAGQAESLRTADLVVANGEGLEEGLADALEAAEEDGVAVFEATAAVETIEFGGEHADEEHSEESDEEHSDEEHSEEDHSEEHSGADPHFWHDPMRVADVVDALAQELAAIDDTLDDGEWRDRATAIRDDLGALDEEVRQMLAVVADEERLLVTNHDSLGYFADAYDFEVVGTVVPGGSTLAEPSAADLQELVETVRDTGTPVVFAETIENARLAEVVAEEAGQEIELVSLYTDSLSEDDGPAATYADFMRTNAELIADALS